MNVVQTAFIDGERLQTLVPWADVIAMYPGVARYPLASTGDGKLVIGWRQPLETDWVNGSFVGDHECPDGDERHVHGQPWTVTAC